jgi:hypothetical protein
MGEMQALLIGSIVAFVPVLGVLVRLIQLVGKMQERASQDKGFGMRRPSLGPAERKRWNEEFWRWKVMRVPIVLTLLEGLLLAFALRIPRGLFELWLFLAVWQVVPLALLYGGQLWLLFRFGRFHLERFDDKQQVARWTAIVLIAMCAWMPLPATWCFLRYIV